MPRAMCGNNIPFLSFLFPSSLIPHPYSFMSTGSSFVFFRHNPSLPLPILHLYSHSCSLLSASFHFFHLLSFFKLHFWHPFFVAWFLPSSCRVSFTCAFSGGLLRGSGTSMPR